MSKDQEAGRLKAAARWYAELQDPHANEDTWDAFRAWEADPANEAAFRQVEAGLQLADRSALGQTPPSPHASPHPARRPTPPSRALKTAAIWLACAAAALALGAVSFLLIHADPAPQALTYASAIGEIRTHSLADGSQVTLNTDSEFTVSYSATERRVDLVRGQALFAVAPEARPFTVRAAGTETRALGTMFEIFLRPEDMSVTLIEGSVSVAPQTAGKGQGTATSTASRPETPAATRLRPGDRLVMRAGHIASLTQVDTQTALSWRSGMLQFRDVTLEAAVAEMNRYSATVIRIEDPDLAALRLSGTFPAGEPDDFAKSLELLLPVRAQTSGNEIWLRPVKNAR